jgi:hypothetical protein
MGGPVLADDLLWEKEATAARHSALDNVRATAKDWSQSIGLILGAFTTAAFLKGPGGFHRRAWRWLHDAVPVPVHRLDL